MKAIILYCFIQFLFPNTSHPEFDLTKSESHGESLLSYSLEDINSNSETYGQNIGPASFENKITVNYFGHQN